MNTNLSSSHGSNVTNLQLLITDVTGYGNRYDTARKGVQAIRFGILNLLPCK